MFKTVLLTLGFLGALTLGASSQTVYPSCPTTQTACKYVHIAANATTIVKSGPGFLHTISINTKGASANIFTVYDNTSGTGNIIAIINTVDAPTNTFIFDVGFNTGLTIVSATGTSADITVSYR